MRDQIATFKRDYKANSLAISVFVIVVAIFAAVIIGILVNQSVNSAWNFDIPSYFASMGWAIVVLVAAGSIIGIVYLVSKT